MGSITTRDGITLHYQDWGPCAGPVVLLSHGWPLNADSLESQALHLAQRGFRVVAHDRRGHGRSCQPWDGHDMDHYADDLAALVEALDLRGISLFGVSAGGGEVARYVGRHGTARIARLGLIAAVTPLLLRMPDNPRGLPMAAFDALRAASLDNRAQLYSDLASGPFYGFNRAGAAASQALIDRFVLQGLQAGHKAAYDGIAAFGQTDFRRDLVHFDRPTLVLHGDDDQMVPVDGASRAAEALGPQAVLRVYAGAPHGLTETHKQRLNQDMLAFLQG
ncbi:alpha/beta fold hydrolase [Paracraurococcus ruber]|uniref:Alpha/beta hydrolase n=1 Tax=Paracraurococcus ruber TaxID=77675 RepID=A0ABS1CQS6_9PROT|nr:alpha/beta hydrolase [Paracraurococcus ruber]MBK1656789.1 alpha/beta hydrolase [Paracraurococcus ruber]TDG33606.1 alpha/beta hydrolase [Paracraurococcus ruber]